VSAIPKEVRFNWNDLQEMPDDGKRYEVIDGDLYVSPSPFPWHQRTAGALFGAINLHVRKHKLGRTFIAPLDVKFGFEDVVEPDVVYFSRERLPDLPNSVIEIPPDLAVEVLSKSSRSRDLGPKMKLFARFSVPHYWVADPDAQKLTAYRLSGGGVYAIEAELTVAEVFKPSLFPGLEISLAEVFER